MAFISDNVRDSGLAYATTNGNLLHIVSTDPTGVYATVTGNSLGTKAVTVGAATDGASGRKVVVPAITDGSVSGTGTATHWALVYTTGSEVIASGSLTAGVAVTSGNTFTLDAIDVQIADA